VERIAVKINHSLLKATPLAVALCSGTAAEELPNPLSLDTAMHFAEHAHPELDLQLAQVDEHIARVSAARASYGLDARLDVIPRFSDFAADPGRDLENDSRVSLLLRKRWYDFGRTRSLTGAAEAEVAGEEALLLNVRQKRRLDIMRRFLAVILADLKYLADDEEMSRLYVRYDKARERQQLGMLADVDILELETAYREALDIRAATEAQRRYTRLQLALALGVPDALPADLVRPRFPRLEEQTPDYQTLFVEVAAGNPQLMNLRARRDAAKLGVDAARSLRHPELVTEVGANYLERKVGTREAARIDLQLRIPLYQGGIERAAAAEAEARLQQREAELRSAEFVLRQELLRLLQQLDVLRIKRRTAKGREDYRDFAVDRARGIYELELDTSLGESMARLTEAQYLSAKVEFETAMTWARLDSLMGELPTYTSGKQQ
jgi:outer membrane protein TolC